MRDRWSDEQWSKALRLARRGVMAHDIAGIVGMSEHQVILKFRTHGYARLLKHHKSISNVHYVQSASAPESIIADRDARYEAMARRTQTQEFFGDPPPGYSALDKKRAAESASA